MAKVAEAVLSHIAEPRLDEGDAIAYITARAPELTQDPTYVQLLDRITLHRDTGVTVFKGHEINVNNSGGKVVPAWLYPVVIWGKNPGEWSVFHVTSVGQDLWSQRHEAKRDDNLIPADRAQWNFASETALLLQDQESEDVAAFQKALDTYDGQAPKIIVRMGIAGNVFHPLTYAPSDIPSGDILHERMQRLAFELRLSQETIPEIPTLQQLGDRERAFEEIARYEYNHATFLIGEPRTIEASFGRVYVYPVQIQNGKERYIEIIATAPIKTLAQYIQDKMARKESPHLNLRPDSRCERCQTNGDGGCGCKAQSVGFLTNGIKTQTPSFLISYPTHDANGQGTAIGLGVVRPIELGKLSLNGELPTRRPVSDVTERLFGSEGIKRDFMLGIAAARLALFGQEQLPENLVIGIDTGNAHKEAVVRTIIRGQGVRIVPIQSHVELSPEAEAEQRIRRHDPTYQEVDPDMVRIIDSVQMRRGHANDILLVTDMKTVPQIPEFTTRALGHIARCITHLRRHSSKDLWQLSDSEVYHSFPGTAGEIQTSSEYALQLLKMGEAIVSADLQDEEQLRRKDFLLEELQEIAQELRLRSLRELFSMIRTSLDYNWETLHSISEREETFQQMLRRASYV